MKRIVILSVLMAAFMSTSAYVCAQETDVGYVWKDGFLEKEYSAAGSKIADASKQLSKDWLPLRVLILKEGSTSIGTIISYGVGDKEGIFVVGKGGTVQIREVTKGANAVVVGIKCGDGDIDASRLLHRRFQEILSK